MLVTVLVSAYATDVLGVHALFGAFFAGVIMPRAADAERVFTDRIEPITTALLLPLFFASSGLRTSLPLINDWALVGETGTDTGRRRRRQGDRLCGGGTRDGHDMGRCVTDRHPAQHARAGRAGGPQHRPRPGHSVAGTVFDDGDHGVRHDLRDIPAAVVGRQASTNVVTRRRARSRSEHSRSVSASASRPGMPRSITVGKWGSDERRCSRHSFMMRMPNGLCRSK